VVFSRQVIILEVERFADWRIKTVRGTNTPNGSYKLMDVAQVHPQTASMLCTFFELLTPPDPPL
jgi:hypothetical protein